MEYNLELERALEHIRRLKPKRVLLQFPDGLKPRAGEVVRALREASEAEFVVWGGSCFGACDVPVHVRSLGFDMIIAWGHTPWRMEENTLSGRGGKRQNA